MTKLLAARPNSFDWPTSPVEYPGGMFRPSIVLFSSVKNVAERLTFHEVGRDQNLALAVVALDLRRARSRLNRCHVGHQHVTKCRRRHIQSFQRLGRVTKLLVHAQLNVVAIVSFAIGCYLIVAAHQHPHRVRDRRYVDVEIGCLVTIHQDAQFGLAGFIRTIEVSDAWNLRQLGLSPAARIFPAAASSGPCRKN